MSKYTTELRYICESLSGLEKSKGFNDIDTIVKNSRDKIFNFQYPFYSLETKINFETDFLKCYYTREICEETFGLWQLRLQNKLNLIMPYYIELYKTLDLEYNPLLDTDITTNYTKDSKGNNKGTVDKTDNGSSKTNTSIKNTEKTNATNSTNTTNNTKNNSTEKSSRETKGTENGTNEHSSNSTVTKKNTDRFSDTPQGGLTSLENNTYLTNGRIIDDTTKTNFSENNKNSATTNGTDTVTGSVENTVTETGQNTTTINNDVTNNTENNISNTTSLISNTASENTATNNESFTQRVQGKSSNKSYMEMISEYRKNIININRAIIDDLSDLFILLWE